ncbi:MAG: GAF domain-containing protein, partial [Anaerolineae bacterium]
MTEPDLADRALVREPPDVPAAEGDSAIREMYQIIADRRLDFNEKIRALLAMGCRRFEMNTGILSRVEGTNFEVIEAWPPDGAIRAGNVFELGQTYCCDALIVAEPVAFEHAAASVWANHPCYARRKIEAYLGTRVMVDGQTYGTLSFSSPVPRGRPFRPADKEFLSLIAQWIGGEIEREQKTRQLQAYATELAASARQLALARD